MGKVCVGVLLENSSFLLAKRDKSKLFGELWEFPGGKLEESESLDDCLVREFKEELAIDVLETEFFMTKKVDNKIFLTEIVVFLIRKFQGEIKLSPDHTEHIFVNKDSYKNLNFVNGHREIIEELFKRNII